MSFYEYEPLSTGSFDRVFIDDFLARFDRFTQGANELLPDLRAQIPSFNAHMVGAIEADPLWAAGRAIMYPILQVGGFVPVTSAYGRSLASLLGGAGPKPVEVKGQSFYFSADLYSWWEKERERYSAYPLYDEWRERDFAQQVAIPMFSRTRSA
jgi:hypothetical protein